MAEVKKYKIIVKTKQVYDHTRIEERIECIDYRFGKSLKQVIARYNYTHGYPSICETEDYYRHTWAEAIEIKLEAPKTVEVKTVKPKPETYTQITIDDLLRG